jgi:outer membrane receptor protein involved in Fe transport
MNPNSALRYLLIGFYVLAFSTGLLFPQAQTKQLQTWLDDLEYLDTPTVGLEEQRAGVAQIISRIEFWQKLYPGSGVLLPSVPSQPWSTGQTRDLISALKDTVQLILKQNPSRPFEIGAMEISVTAETSPLSPVVAGISHSEIRNLHVTDIAQAIPYLPGIGVDHNSSSGRSGIMIRGFDTRQVGFYLDGIPLYVPYDGFVDISRFLTSDISEIEVAKGYSSPLLGPNGLGGAVNLVTRQPEKKFNAEAAIGTGSGNMLESWLHLGSAWRDFYIQGGIDWL